MSLYANNIILAVVTFPLFAFVITIPYMIHQYRRFGSIPWLRTIMVYLFVFYLICSYYLVILPLPDDVTAVVPYAEHPQLIPFNFVADFFTTSGFVLSNPATWISAVLSSDVFEAVFNVLLLVPLGMFLRYYFRRTWWQTLLIGFSVTLFFELSQLTGLFGVYLHPYRLFDVDDLILNSLGAMVGFWVMGPAKKVLPNMTLINQEARKYGMQVSLIRRVLAFVIDIALIEIVLLLIVFASISLKIPMPNLSFGFGNVQLPGFDFIGGLLVFFVLVPSLMRGRTIGQRILKLVIVKPDATKVRWYQFLARYALLFVAIYGFPCALDALMAFIPVGSNEASSFAKVLPQLVPWVLLLWGLVVAVWLISIPFRNHHAKGKGRLLVLFYELLSGTRIMTLEGAAALRDRMLVLDVAEVAALEYMIAEEGLSLAELMDRAGKSVAEAIQERNPDPTEVLIFCGLGNNGGDGWVLARELAAKEYQVTVVSPILPTEIEADPAKTAAIEAFADSKKEDIPLRIIVKPNKDMVEDCLAQAEVLVDAMLGTGFSGKNLREPYADWIKSINVSRGSHKGDYLIAIDTPSGFSAQTGEHAEPCIEADATITMLAYKPGLLMPNAVHFCGEIHLARLTDISPYLARFTKSLRRSNYRLDRSAR